MFLGRTAGAEAGADAPAELRRGRGRAGGRKGLPARVSFDGVALAVVAEALGVPVGRLVAVCAGIPPRARPVFLRGAMLVGSEGWQVPRSALDVLAVCAGWPYVTIEEAADLLGLDASTLHKRSEELPMIEVLPAVTGGRALRRVALGLLLSGKAKREEGESEQAGAEGDRQTHSGADKNLRKGARAGGRARIGAVSGALPLAATVQTAADAGAGGSLREF